VTTEGIVAAETGMQTDDGRMFCYRHPDRETWLRCGRCDRPICTGCAMQGPVGSRCRQCGKPAFDPLTSFTMQQVVLGLAVALAAGAVIGFLASRLGWIAIIVAFFAGGLIVDAVRRVAGYKTGPVMFAIVFGGIIVGTLAGFGLGYAFLLAEWADLVGEERLFISSFLAETAIWAVITAGAACFGAYRRIH
jgi:hypothetical protein